VTETVRRWLAVCGLVVSTELRRWARQPVAVASAFLLPVGMATLISLVIGGDAAGLSVTVAVADEEQGPASTAFLEQALGDPSVDDVLAVERVGREDQARRLVDQGRADVLVVLPEGLTDRLASSRATGIVVQGEDPLAADLVLLVTDQFVTRARATALALSETGASPSAPWPLEVSVTAPDGQALDAATHYGPGVAMFFVLVGLGFAAQRLVADRQRELVDRLAVAPVPLSAALMGRGVAALTVGGVSLATAALAMQLLFGIGWGPVLPVAVMIVAAVGALAGVAASLAALCRTPGQAQMLSAGVAFVFALASGTFSPPGSIATRPAFAELVPTTHALDGFALLATEDAGLATVAVPLAALALFGLGGLAVTAVAARRLI
jgi:ABC-type multidrug transport system permease subunit